MKKARMLTLVWGQPYVDWFDRACVQSLELPRNKKALQEGVSVWDICTRPDNQDLVKDIAGRLELNIEFHLDPMGTPDQHGDILQRALMAQMHRCIAANEGLILTPPDSIFGDGTMENLIALGQPREVCISVPHVRVRPTILDIPWRANSNANLVAASWKHLHRTWVESDGSRKMTNTYSGGCSWRKISENTYAVCHRIPTTYYANFNDSDPIWWKGVDKINVWDHAWPSKTVAETRHRMVGSSDACFIAEVTPEFANIPPCTPNDSGEPDKYWGRAAHHMFNRNSINIFRAETP